MKSLIVNADDFGLTPGVNAGIVRACREGILTSTTLMANAPAFDDAVALAKANPGIDIGVHLVLIGGRSVAPPEEIPSLSKKNGDLPGSLFELVGRLSGGLIQSQDIEREFRAQIERIIAAGIQPSHLDTHKHTHAHPIVMEELFRVAREFGILRVRKPFEETRVAAKVPKPETHLTQRFLISVAGMAAPAFRRGLKAYSLRAPDYFFGVTLTGYLCSNALRHLISQMPEGVSEIMCHPGVYDADLQQTSTRLKEHRQVELDALLDSEVGKAVRDTGVHLMPYRDLN
ncbi:MAG: ChbG/HpnK family deacetylase [Candidatus Acidiferrales bacterium]